MNMFETRQTDFLASVATWGIRAKSEKCQFHKKSQLKKIWSKFLVCVKAVP